MQNVKSMLLDALREEYSQFLLWLPVLFGLGIALYFALPFEPKLFQATGIATLTGSLLLLLHRNRFWRNLLIIMVFITGGFMAASYRAHMVKAPVIPDSWKQSYLVTATVDHISKQAKGYRVWLNDVSLAHIRHTQTPKRIRISVHTRLNGATAGDHVSFKAILYPPPKPAMPGAYDFARQAYFEQIGAVGYSISSFTILEHPSGFSFPVWISDFRQTLANRILTEGNNSTESSVATALLVGERNSIPESVMDNMRSAGLAHLLAISGLHLSLVAAICFFASRAAFALSERLTLRYPIKQWAAGVAILCSAAYLLISGNPISAERAFIMTTMVLLAIMLNRMVTPLRSVAFAAFIVLLFTPESLLSPSFQMSFAAATALIAAFEVLRKPLSRQLEDAGPLRRFRVYLTGVLLSSLVAGFATAPFALYHFSHANSYGLLANLVAVPLTSFWIMPWGVVALALMPLHLEHLALIPMNWGIDGVLHAAASVAALPYSNLAITALPIASLACIAIGMLWLTLWKTKLRLLGCLMLIPAITIAMLQPKPDVLINEDGRMLAFKDTGGHYVFPAKTSPSFVQKSWMERLGQSDFKRLKPPKTLDNLTCDSDRNCRYQIAGKTLLLAHTPDYAAAHCAQAHWLIDMDWKDPISCPQLPPLFNRQDLKAYGTHILYFSKDDAPARIETVAGYRGHRLW